MQRVELDNRLNQNIAGSANDVSACYMNKIYVKRDNNDIYELALVNSDFTRVQLIRVTDLHDIISFYDTRDFNLDEDYLVCDPHVPMVQGESIIDTDAVFGEECEKNLFSFLIEGARNRYVVLDDSVIEGEEIAGYGMTYFHNIRFSKSTMSIYVPMYNGDGIYNKIICAEEQGRLLMRQFYFGVVSGDECNYGDFVTKKLINNIEYDIYKIEFLPVFSNLGKIISAPIINTAIHMGTRLRFCIDTLSELMHSLYDVSEDKVQWVGGSNSYTSSYTIQFESTLPKITKRLAHDILNAILCGEEPFYADDERVVFLSAIVGTLERDEEGDPTLNALSSMIATLKSLSIAPEAYIMLVRYYLFCSHKLISESVGNGGGVTILHGGISKEGTIVKEGY